MIDKLRIMIEAVSHVPGLSFLGQYASEVGRVQSKIGTYKSQAVDTYGNVQHARDSVGLEGDSDDGADSAGMPAGPGQEMQAGFSGSQPNSGRTVPRPGAGAGRESMAGYLSPARLPAVVGSGLNPLVDAATVLLSLEAQLRGSIAHSNVDGLREQVVRELQQFEQKALQGGCGDNLVIAGRYALCTALDESVLSTPWGSESVWSRQSMLSTFHNETWGGEKFFQIVERASQDPVRNLHLLELLYLCLGMGFQGKYKVMDRGRDQLELVQDNLYRTIRLQRSDFERELSVHWRGMENLGNALVRYVPLWVVTSLSGLLLLSIYAGFSYTLNGASDPVFAQIQAIGRDQRPLLEREPSIRRASLAGFLESEVSQGLLDIHKLGRQTTVVIRGDGLFASGSIRVKEKIVPLIQRVAVALNSVPGNVLVTGHTDSMPIRTPRFPSNWHLSQERAEAVLRILAKTIRRPERLRAEGRADTEPLVNNDTPKNRARNRRVEITLLSRTTPRTDT